MSIPAIIPSFALISGFSLMGDSGLSPSAALIVTPNPVGAGDSVTLLWVTSNVYAVQVTGSEFTTGIINTTGSGIYVVAAGFESVVTLVLTGYNLAGAAVISDSVLLNVDASTAGI